MHFLAFAGIQLIPDASILIHIVLVLVMIWILNRTFFKPINKIMTARDRSRGGHSSEADEILAQAEAKNNQLKKELFSTREQTYSLIEEERKVALEARQANLADAKAAAAKALLAKTEDLESQVAKAKADVADEAAKIAEKISKNILGAA